MHVYCKMLAVAVDDTYPLAATGDTVIPAASGILANDNVPCGSAATITVVTPPAHGTLTAIARSAKRRAEGSFTYKPTGAPVADSFVYEVDCNGLMSRACSKHCHYKCVGHRKDGLSTPHDITTDVHVDTVTVWASFPGRLPAIKEHKHLFVWDSL